MIGPMTGIVIAASVPGEARTHSAAPPIAAAWVAAFAGHKIKLLLKT
jgi:hypothetical protein